MSAPDREVQNLLAEYISSFGRHCTSPLQLAAAEWRSWGAGQPCTSYKKRLSRKLALGEGKVVDCEFVGDSIIWNLSEPNLQGSACELRTKEREGITDFSCVGFYKLAHHAHMYFSITQLHCSSWLWLFCTSPATHCEAGLDDSLLFTMQRGVSLNLPASPRVGVWECTAGQTPKTALDKLRWALRET